MGPPLEGHGKGFTQDLQRFYTLILIRNQLQKGTYKSRWEQRIIKLKLILGIFVWRANRNRRNDELANNSQEFSIFCDHNIKNRQRQKWIEHFESSFPLYNTRSDVSMSVW